MSEDVRSWSRNILGPVVTEERQEWKEQEDEEAGNTETAGRTSVIAEQSGAEEPQRRTEDRWPGEPTLEPPRFRRSVAFPGTETGTGKGAGKGGGRIKAGPCGHCDAKPAAMFLIREVIPAGEFEKG
ncbi:hypothetical protein NDU88_007335 [Pleurodeles waltl]|uniref:Uncharacterized protein n=1 Tax=Pleurodeles waltl TaxID=8319 RepID=A0AAV7VU48_PLEWA|nr:hypothetical protein NDU88_007335 [Pleurodeles waltl]